MKYAFLGMSLEHGTKTIAYFNLFSYSVMAAIFIINSHVENFSTFYMGSGEDEPTTTTTEHPYFSYRTETWALGKNIKATFFLESTTVLQIVFSSYLLYGATVRHPKLLFSWILLQTGIIFHSQVIVVLNFVMLFDERTSKHGEILSFIFQEIATIGILAKKKRI
ncbi:hypothetical protein GE061_013051 [Apolygus lucorum]|uniref:Uncharacterized protein n=1 Tax=Apolygus lucorum TaxID=248454 RepID=A0A8S9XW91_APOLU|nr:hypothetical protein GE061_013051 [Apolygus lucorum]